MQATNAYYACYLYFTVANDQSKAQFSQLLMTMEIQALQLYWHMSNDTIYDNIFSCQRMAGMFALLKLSIFFIILMSQGNIGALDATISTWFGDDPQYVNGINM
jgi:endoglucanase Acf2